jgi:hypothetical protein
MVLSTDTENGTDTQEFCLLIRQGATRREASQLNTRATLELVGDGRNGEATVMLISVARARRRMKSQQWA